MFHPEMRRIPVSPDTGRLDIPSWLNFMIGGGATNPKVVEAVIVYHAALDAIATSSSIETPGNKFDIWKAEKKVVDLQHAAERAEKKLPLWARIYEALP